MIESLRARQHTMLRRVSVEPLADELLVDVADPDGASFFHQRAQAGERLRDHAEQHGPRRELSQVIDAINKLDRFVRCWPEEILERPFDSAAVER